MATIDSLEIKISAEATKVVSELDKISKSLDSVSKKLGPQINVTGLKNVSKELGIASKEAENLNSKNAISGLSKQFSDVGKSFKVPNTLKEVQEQIVETQGKLEKLGDKEERAIDLGTKLDSIGFKGIQRDIAENLNKLDLLITKEKELQAIQEAQQKPLNIHYYNQGLQERPDNPRFAALSSLGSTYNSDAMRMTFGEGYEEIQNWNQALNELGFNASAVFNGLSQNASNFTQAVSIGESVSMALKTVYQNFPTVALQGAKNILSGMAKTGAMIAKTFGKTVVSGISKATKAVTGFGKSSKGIFGGGFMNILKYAFGIRSLYMLFNKLRQAIVGGFQNLAQFSGETNKSISSVVCALAQLKNALATAFNPILTVIAPALTTFINLISRALNVFGQFTAALTGKSVAVQAVKVSKDYAAGLSENLGSAAKNAKKAKQAMTTLGIDELNINAPQDEQDASGGGNGGKSPSEMFKNVNIPQEILDFAEKVKEAWKNADFTEIGMIVGNKLNSALESIDWGKIQNTTNKIAKSVATFLNGFIMTVDWKLVGNTFANGLNTLIYGGYTFVKTFNWKQFGKAISDGVVGFIEKIDIGKAAAGFSGLVKGLLDTAVGAVQNTDWSRFATTIGTKIKEAVRNIDFSGIASSLFELIGSALGGIATFVGTAISDAFTGAKDYFQEIADENGVSIGEGILIGIKDAFKNIGTWIKENIWNPFVEGFKETFGIHSPAETMKPIGKNIILGVIEGFSLAYDSLSEKLREIWDLISKKFEEIKKTITDKITEAKNKVFEKFEEIRKAISDKVTSAKETVSTKFEEIRKTISDKINSAKETVSTTFENIKKTISDKLVSAKKVVTDAFDNIKKTISDKIGQVKIKFGEFKDSVDEVIKKIKDFFGFNGKSFSISLPTKIFEGFKDLIGKAVDKLKELFGFNGRTVTINTKSEGVSATSGGFATGGFPQPATYFWAGENGVPEILGTVGGRTAVAGGAEITGIRDAVYDVGQSETALLRTAVSLLEVIASKNTSVKIDGRDIVNAYDERKSRNGFSFT